MLKALMIFFLFICLKVDGQWVQRSVYADSTLGWIKVYHYKGAKQTVQIDHRLYSIPQLSICDTFVNWMQQSFQPKGCVGDVKKAVSEKLSEYNQDTKSMPQAYGAYTKIYLDLKRGPDGKLVPFDNTGYQWNIMANGKIGDGIQLISTPEQYYFYIPAYGKADMQDEYAILAKKNLDVSNHAQLKKYKSYFQPDGIHTSSRMMVILSRNNVVPYVQITKGEYIEQMAKAVERKYQEEKDYAIKGWPEGKVRDEMLKKAKGKYDERVKILDNQRLKYKDRLTEKASIFTVQPSALIEQYQDLFEGNESPARRQIPVYKYDPVLLANTKKDNPQWIAIFWDISPIYNQDKKTNNYDYAAMKIMHESILQHFNFDFVYHFFFEPEKVKGKLYQPLHPF